jgi:hypothetical protein
MLVYLLYCPQFVVGEKSVNNPVGLGGHVVGEMVVGYELLH